MIFNNHLTEKEIIDIIVKESGYESGFVFRINYSYNDKVYLQEAKIPAKDLGAPGKTKQITRYVLITGSGTAKHPGRMKVTKRGGEISRNTNYNDYIEIYRKDANSVTYDGDLKKIDMSSKELDFYINLFIRNENLIQLVRFSNGQYDAYIDTALIKDEQLRISGMIVIRNKDGDVLVCDSNGRKLYKENIMGERI